MIELYYWPTQNGRKISIFFEETEVPYKLTPINIHKGEQFAPAFLEISPNNKMPVIVDPEGPDGEPISVFESAAILMYLGEKYGRLLPTSTRGRYNVMQWLVFQVASIGPMFGQRNHFRLSAPEQIPHAIERFTNETQRLLNVLERQLSQSEYLAGEYSIADIAAYPWIVSNGTRHDHDQLESRPNLKRWFNAIASRPAVQRGMDLLADLVGTPLDDEARSILHGAKQYERR